MFSSIGPLEIGIIALVVILLFGVGKLSGLGRDLGGSVKEFRRAIKDEDKDKEKSEAAAAPQTIQQAPPPPQQNGYQQPPPQYAPPPQQPQYQQPAPPPQQPVAPQGDSKNIF